MKSKGLKLLIAIVIVFLVSGCTESLKESDLIMKVDKNDLVKTSETDVLSYFEKNKDSIKAISKYMLNNEKAFGTRPVIINKKIGISRIQDDRVMKLTNTLLQEGVIQNISSLNDSIKDVRFIIGSEYGSYEQGLRYVSNQKVIEEDKTKYNYVKYYRDLGNGWYYYLYYYDQIKDGDVYRKIAWDKLTEKDKKSISYDWNKAVVMLEDWKSVGLKIGKTKYTFVVSVCFNTEVDGLLGPIIMYFDPSTKELVGYNLRY